MNNSYKLQAYFNRHEYLKIGAVAEVAGLNPGLVRSYVCGIKEPSDKQMDKIRQAITQIIIQLLEDEL